MRQATADRAELPRTSIIDGSIAGRFAEIAGREPRRDARGLLALASSACREIRARALLESSRRVRTRALERAAKRLTDVELETAWRAALRGDTATTSARILPHVATETPTRTHAGTPWRASGWLTKR